MSKSTDEPNEESSAPPPVELDARGHNPADYKWVPVLRRARSDGWTPERQVKFIAALADCGIVKWAAHEVGMSETACYALRRSPGGENFARAWRAALAHAAERVVDASFERALLGSDEPVFDRDGYRVGRRFKLSDRLAMFIMRAYFPERFRNAHKSVIEPGEQTPRASEPLNEAIRRLQPVPPENPHLLMPRDELEAFLDAADALKGELPHWYRGRGDIERVEEPTLGDDFEELLTQAKGDPLLRRDEDDEDF